LTDRTARSTESCAAAAAAAAGAGEVLLGMVAIGAPTFAET
jgi:hypothetical protein